MLRIVLSIGIGILAGGAAVMVAGPPGAGSWTISVGLILTILPAVFLGIARQTRTIQSPTAEQIRAAGAAGRLGRARVDALAQTGTQINNQPLCDIDLTVQPVTGAFTVSITADYMSFELPVEDGSQRSDDWTYRRGEITHVGPSSIQPDDAREQFPIDDVAWDRLWPSLEEAAQQVGVEDVSESGFTIKRFVSEAEAGSDDFGTMTGPVEAVFTVEDAYESTTFTMNADGSELTAFSG